ncbi:MAG: TetR/AcrR family transcriptional regulator [Anaerolineae bacterium]|nr:TetR/AcrR family transcriptional regulator [Anaerolineae bacterium]
MDAKTETTQQRISAEERRAAVLAAAITEFARNGLAGSSTEVISARAGISQPYLFKLFGTKRRLFLAAYERVMTHMDAVLDDAAAAHPDDPEGAMDAAYRELLKQRDDQLLLLQAYAACGDAEVRAYVRAREARTFAEVLAATEGDLATARRWYARCLLQSIGAVLDLPEFIG